MVRIVYILFFLLLLSCQNVHIYNINDNSKNVQHQVYFVDGEPFTGLRVEYFDEEQTTKSLEAEYSCGIQNGVTIQYSMERLVIAKGYYKWGDKYDGTFLSWRAGIGECKLFMDKGQCVRIINMKGIEFPVLFYYKDDRKPIGLPDVPVLK